MTRYSRDFALVAAFKRPARFFAVFSRRGNAPERQLPALDAPHPPEGVVTYGSPLRPADHEADAWH
jgi:hypothetical protein